MRGEPTLVPGLQIGKLPVITRESPTTFRGATIAGERHERVAITHRVIERDCFARNNSAHRDEGRGVGKAAIWVARVIDEVNRATMIELGVEKCIGVDLQQLLLLVCRERLGIGFCDDSTSPDGNDFPFFDQLVGNHTAAKPLMLDYPQARNRERTKCVVVWSLTHEVNVGECCVIGGDVGIVVRKANLVRGE